MFKVNFAGLSFICFQRGEDIVDKGALNFGSILEKLSIVLVFTFTLSAGIIVLRSFWFSLSVEPKPQNRELHSKLGSVAVADKALSDLMLGTSHS